jgi:hypothetical protein
MKKNKPATAGKKNPLKLFWSIAYPRSRMYFSTPVAALFAVTLESLDCFAMYLATPVDTDTALT